jgi:gas vesicle protein
MLRLLAATLITLSVSFASAGPMKNAMRDMGKAFKKINQTIHDSSQNQNNAVLAQNIAQLLTNVLNEVPETINELPSTEQQEAFNHYQELIQREITLAQQLEQAFLNEDSGSALAIFQEMSDLMDQGHDKFEPQD